MTNKAIVSELDNLLHAINECYGDKNMTPATQGQLMHSTLQTIRGSLSMLRAVITNVETIQTK